MDSPVIEKVIDAEIDFYQALKEIAMGKSVTKKEWKDRTSYGILKDGHLKIHLDGKYHDWLISDGDLAGDDFVIL